MGCKQSYIPASSFPCIVGVQCNCPCSCYCRSPCKHHGQLLKFVAKLLRDVAVQIPLRISHRTLAQPGRLPWLKLNLFAPQPQLLLQMQIIVSQVWASASAEAAAVSYVLFPLPGCLNWPLRLTRPFTSQVSQKKSRSTFFTKMFVSTEQGAMRLNQDSKSDPSPPCLCFIINKCMRGV